MQGAVPVQAPVHPVKSESAAGAAESVTLVPDSKVALHAEGQVIPGGLLVTLPAPEPVRVTVTVTGQPAANNSKGGIHRKFANHREPEPACLMAPSDRWM